MKRHIAAGLAIVAVAAGVGWKLASHPDTSTGLQEISLNQHSEHSNPGAVTATARVRIRVMPNDSGYGLTAAAAQVPHISLAAN